MARNYSFARETPIHLAAKFGQLDKVPKQFLTKETLTASTEYEKKESKTGPTPPRTETPLHYAARCGHADQIPKEFLTPEFLSIEASGYRTTVLHDLAYANRLDLVPKIYAQSEMWNLKDWHGQTPGDVVANNIENDRYIARVRAEPATEKQKAKLRFFGCTWDEGITKGQASDSIDECVRLFPEKEAEYYNRPATEEQMAELRTRLAPDGEEPEDYADPDKSLTYRQAKELLEEFRSVERQKAEEEFDREIERNLRAQKRTGNKIGSSKRDGHSEPRAKSQPRHFSELPWAGKGDTPSTLEAKAKTRLAQHGLPNVEVFCAYAYGNMIINIDAPTDAEIAQAAWILGIQKSDYT